MEMVYIFAAILSLALYIMHFVWMSRISGAATKLAEIIEGEIGMRAALAHDIGILKKHFEAQKLAAEKEAAAAARAKREEEGVDVDDDEPVDPYDKSRIPLDRWYQYAGNIGDRLVAAGVITKPQLQQARSEFSTRGGHLCDHLIALGFVDNATLKAAVGPG